MPLTASVDDLFDAASQSTSASEAGQGIPTGRYIVVFKDGAAATAADHFQNLNLPTTSATDAATAMRHQMPMPVDGPACNSGPPLPGGNTATG